MSEGVVGAEAGHPWVAYVAALEALHAEAAPRLWSLTDAEVADLTTRMERVGRQHDSRYLALVAEADRRSVGDPVGYANTPGWLAAVTGSTKPQARRTVKLAHRLEEDQHHGTREALARGEVSLDQAAVIMKAVEDLPTDLVDTELRGRAAGDLLALAVHHDPRELRVLGRRILEVTAPDIADQALARVLESEEAHAEATSYFRMRPDGHGSMTGEFKVPLVAGRMLEKHLDAIADPHHQHATAALDETGQTVPRPWRLGTAFAEYIATRPGGSTPNTGGIAATIVVTMTLESLLGGLKAAEILDTGEALSASQVRLLAEQARIIPAVLGGTSEVLDLGRARRLHTPAQRLAIALRQKTCIVDGCARGTTGAHFHHLDAWSRGGATSVERGVMACPPHHRQIHDPRYDHTTRPNGKIRFHRRT